MKKAFVAIAISSLTLTTGCAAFNEGIKEGINQGDYTDEMKANYNQTCVAAAIKFQSSEEAKKYCECTFDRISSTVPVDEFVKLDTGDTVKNETTSSFKVAVAQCGGDASKI